MTNLKKLKKAELIKLILDIRPKADAYDRVCEQLGIENDILGFVENLTINSVCDKKRYWDCLHWDIHPSGCEGCNKKFIKAP